MTKTNFWSRDNLLDEIYARIDDRTWAKWTSATGGDDYEGNFIIDFTYVAIIELAYVCGAF